MIKLLFLIFFATTAFSLDSTKVYNVAFLKDWKPYYFLDKKNKPDGYVYDLLEEISKKTNLKFKYKIVNTWEEVFELARNKEIDIVPNIGITKDRDSLFSFTQPTDTFKVKLFKRKNTTKLLGFEDLKGREIGVVTTNICNKLITEDMTDKKVLFEDFSRAFTSLNSGELDVLCYPELLMQIKLKELKLNDSIISFGEALTEVKRGISVTKNNFDVLPILDEALSSLKIDGTFHDIYSKWFSVEENTISKESFFKVLIILIIIIIGLIVSMYWNKILKKQYEKQKELETLLENAQDIAELGHYSYSFKDNHFTCSRQIDELLGLEKNSLSNIETWMNHIHPNDKQRVLSYWEDRAKNFSTYNIEYRLINNKTKKSTRVLVLGKITRDKNFKALSMFGTIQNIEDRKILEEKVLQAMMVFETTHDGIIITDKYTNIINVNKSFEKTTGYKLEDVINKKPSILRSHFNTDDFYKEMWKELSLNGVWSGEIINKKKDKSTYYELLTINTIYSVNKEVNGYIAVFSDITKQKSDEKMLMVQSKVAAVGEMLGNISHQWRQPLSVISTHATGLKMEIEFGNELNKEKLLDSMDKINQQVQYLSKTIDDFRNFFKGDTKDIHEINLKDCFNKLEQLTKDSLNNNYIEYKSEIIDLKITLNENLFIQALINIFNNAKDAIVSQQKNSDDRFVFVKTKKVDNNLEISIKDSGGGIPLNIIDKIFDPYFTTKHSSVGTGIGLYMTNQIITKQFEGEISVNNIEIEKNNKFLKGSEFVISLPLSDNS